MVAGVLHDEGYGPAEPWPFLHRVVPFMQFSEEAGASFKAKAPVAHTLGCSWKWTASSLASDEAQRREKLLSDGALYARGKVDRAVYFWVKSLGLIAPHEGKNRVDFLRGREIEFIPAEVTEYSYPEPQRLKIHRIVRNRCEQVWVVLDERWVEKIEHPAWACPLLEAYGWHRTHFAPSLTNGKGCPW